MIQDTKTNLRLTKGQTKVAYQQTFNKESVAVKAVIKDLAKFCRADTTTFHENERMHALLEGRREVFLRIQQHINLTVDELLQIMGVR